MAGGWTIIARAANEAATRLALLLVPLIVGCGPGNAQPNPWGALEIAYLASPTTTDGVVSRELRVTDAAGTEDVAVEHARAVTSDAVAWSPDGQRIAYVGELLPEPTVHAATTGGLYAVDHDAEELLAEIWDTSGYGGSSPALSWSPRGDRIALVRSGLSWAPQCVMAGVLLLVVDLDSSTPRDPSTVDVRLDAQNSDIDPSALAWSPDGESVAVGAEHLFCDDEGQLVSFGWNVQLCGHENIACSSYSGGVNSDEDEWLGAWSPDGERLVVLTGTRFGSPSSAQLDVWAADLSSSAPLTSGACSHEGAAWFPDGDRVLTRRSCGEGLHEHVVIDAGTGRVEKVLPDLGVSVSIAPDGLRLLHVTSDDPSRISIYDLEEDRATVLAAGEAPAWRPR